jgi:hypothetical protein
MAQKELTKLSQWFWRGFSKWYDGGGENGITSKRIFKIEIFFSSKNIDFPFYLKRLLELYFFLLFFFMLHRLRTWGFWWYLRRKSFLQKLLFNWLQYTGDRRIFWNGVIHANMANSWLWRWGAVDILAMDAYSGVEVCTPIFLDEASKFFFQNSNRRIP